jgi:hypothetical protein
MIVLAALVVLASGVATAANIVFSFSNDPAMGNVSGTVIGELFGLPDNGTGPATAVVIDSYPAGLVSSGNYTPPFDVLTWTGGTVVENSFTLVGGVVTGGSFSIISANGVNDQLYINSQCECAQGGLELGTNFLDIGSIDSLFVWNDNGIGPTGVTFGNAAIPEPASLLLIASALLGLAALRRKFRS